MISVRIIISANDAARLVDILESIPLPNWTYIGKNTSVAGFACCISEEDILAITLKFPSAKISYD